MRALSKKRTNFTLQTLIVYSTSQLLYKTFITWYNFFKNKIFLLIAIIKQQCFNFVFFFCCLMVVYYLLWEWERKKGGWRGWFCAQAREREKREETDVVWCEDRSRSPALHRESNDRKLNNYAHTGAASFLNKNSTIFYQLKKQL